MNVLVSTLCFKQPFVNLEDQIAIYGEGYPALLQIKVRRAQFSFSSKNDMVA